MNIRDEIEEIKEKIDLAKTKRAKLEGQLEQIESEFKKIGCDSIEDAYALLEAKEKELGGLRSELETGLEELNSKYDWVLV